MEEAKAKKGKEIDFTDIEMPTGAFDNVTLREAILKALFYIDGIPIKSGDLARQLENRGFEHGSKNFANTVNTTISRIRLPPDSLVEKMVNGWVLTPKGMAECRAMYADAPHPYALQFR